MACRRQSEGRRRPCRCCDELQGCGGTPGAVTISVATACGGHGVERWARRSWGRGRRATLSAGKTGVLRVWRRSLDQGGKLVVGEVTGTTAVEQLAGSGGAQAERHGGGADRVAGGTRGRRQCRSGDRRRGHGGGAREKVDGGQRLWIWRGGAMDRGQRLDEGGRRQIWEEREVAADRAGWRAAAGRRGLGGDAAGWGAGGDGGQVEGGRPGDGGGGRPARWRRR